MPTINELYRLNNSHDPLTVKVIIGEAGLAETTVYLDGIKVGTFSNSFEISPGLNNELINKKLEIRSYAGKIIPGNHHSSILISLSGGYEEKTYPLKDQSSDNPVVFLANFYLTI